MSAIIVPFRFCRRVPQIRKTAAFMAAVPHNHAEGHLRQQLRRLSEGLRAKGVADDLIRSEVSAYEGAIRAHLWRLLLSEGGAA
ncbi:hypothetical protein PKCBPO_02515 [Methylorubrum thiocyanatum]